MKTSETWIHAVSLFVFFLIVTLFVSSRAGRISLRLLRKDALNRRLVHGMDGRPTVSAWKEGTKTGSPADLTPCQS